MTLTRIRLVSLYIKFAPVTMTDIFILVLISISSALVTVDSHLSTSDDPSPSYTTYPEDDIGGVVSPYLDSSSNSSRIRRNMGIALPGYPRVIPVSSRVPAYVIPAGNTTG